MAGRVRLAAILKETRVVFITVMKVEEESASGQSGHGYFINDGFDDATRAPAEIMTSSYRVVAS
jgi:hypothetical protein